MSCTRCQNDPQPPQFGDPRKCAFTESGEFTPTNWNCATLDALLQQRGIDAEGIDESLQARYAGTYRGWIVLTRYKHRGCTSSAVCVGDFYPARPLTLTDALIALGDLPVPDDEPEILA